MHMALHIFRIEVNMIIKYKIFGIEVHIMQQFSTWKIKHFQSISKELMLSLTMLLL